MQYSREHTRSGHSEYQDAILTKFDEKGLMMQSVETPFSVVTLVVNPETHFATSFSVNPKFAASHENSDEEVCRQMNKFLGKSYLFHFGTDFDGAVEE